VLAYVETLTESPSKSLRTPERVSWHTVNNAQTSAQFDVVTPSKHPEAFATVPPLAGWASVAAAAVAAAPVPKPAHSSGGRRGGGGGGGKKTKQRAAKPKPKKRARNIESDADEDDDDDEDGEDDDGDDNDVGIDDVGQEKEKPAEGVFIVEAVLASRQQKGKAPEYFVHWEGYPHSDNTWEPASNLKNNVLLKQFLKTQRKSAIDLAVKKKAVVVRAVGGWGPTSAKHGVAKAVPAATTAAAGATSSSSSGGGGNGGRSGSGSSSKSNPPSSKRRKVTNVQKGGSGSRSGKGATKQPFRPAIRSPAATSTSSSSSSISSSSSSSASPPPSASASSASAFSLAGSRADSSSKLIWAAVDGGQAAEDPTQRFPCPFATCSTFHVGLGSVERHLRKHHVLEKTCLCGRAFISDSSLVQHYKDNIVFDFANSNSNKMFNCRP